MKSLRQCGIVPPHALAFWTRDFLVSSAVGVDVVIFF